MKVEQRIVFAISTDHEDAPFVLVGIPTGAWEYMKDGHTQTIDLTKTGLPVRLALFGAKDYEAAVKILTDDCAKKGIRVTDQRGKDFSIDFDKEKS